MENLTNKEFIKLLSKLNLSEPDKDKFKDLWNSYTWNNEFKKELLINHKYVSYDKI